jgi:hypothetical protein
MTFVMCDLCRKELRFDDSNLNQAIVMVLAPGLIYYPERNFGSYNGAEVHMECAAEYQRYVLGEGFVKIGG